MTKMNAHRIFYTSLAVAALICGYAHAQTTFSFKEWDTVEVAAAGTVLDDGSVSRMTQATDFANTTAGKTFSLGVFKSGSMHRITLDTLGGGGSASEELTFSLGWYVNWDWVQFHTHQIYGDQTTSHFHWSPTYDSSGKMNEGEIELFAVVTPQTTGTRVRVKFQGDRANWSTPAGKTAIDSRQLPLTQVVASQTNYSISSGNSIYFSGNQMLFNGSPILSQASATGYLAGEGFLTSTSLGTALASATPPISSTAWTNAFVPRGTVSNGGTLALGTSTASGLSSFASGAPSSVASGQYSFASGLSSTASGGQSVSFGGTASGSNSFSIGAGNVVSGNYSFGGGAFNTASGLGSFVWGVGSSASAAWGTAFGSGNSVSGDCGFAAGTGNQVRSHSEAVFGRYNSFSGPSNTGTWSASDPLFSLGNGSSNSSRSNAMVTLKNGQTTLTNKAWLANAGHPLDDPVTTPDEDSGGKALVVEGHTELKGKVIISEPQGNIPMFEGN